MTISSVKIAYALLTIGVATLLYLIGKHGGDTTWLAGAYFVATIVFAALTIFLTLEDANSEESRKEKYFRAIDCLLSYWAVSPPMFFLWGFLQHDLNLALFGFIVSSTVSAVFYLLIQAFRLAWPSRRGVR